MAADGHAAIRGSGRVATGLDNVADARILVRRSASSSNRAAAERVGTATGGRGVRHRDGQRLMSISAEQLSWARTCPGGAGSRPHVPYPHRLLRRGRGTYSELDDLARLGPQDRLSEVSAESICLDPPPGELAEPITLRDKLACVWKQLLAAPSQISVAVDLRSVTK